MSHKVSIIIPSFNRAHCIAETLQSVMAQSYEHWECIVIDDGSTDDTVAVVQKCAKKDDRIILLHRDVNRPKGANACRNIGIEKSKGAYLIFLDSDDLLHSDCLKNRLLHFNEDDNYDGLVFTTGLVAINGAIATFNPARVEDFTMEDYLMRFLTYDIPWQITNPIWKKKAVVQTVQFDEEFMRFQDVDFHTNLLLHGLKIKRIDEIDFYYKATDDIHKYQDDQFITKACTSILAYISKYVTTSDVFILTQTARKKALRVMFLKTLRKFIYGHDRILLFKTFIQFNKRHSLLSFKQSLSLRGLYIIEKHRLLSKKGLGIYRIEKQLRIFLFQ